MSAEPCFKCPYAVNIYYCLQRQTHIVQCRKVLGQDTPVVDRCGFFKEKEVPR